MSKDDSETVSKFDNQIRLKADELSFKMFGVNRTESYNSMAMQSLDNPNTGMEMLFTSNNLVNMLRTLIDKEYKKDIQRQAEIFNSSKFEELNSQQPNWVQKMLPFLWYSKLPCFDIDQITSEMDGEAGLLKLCKWKGRKIPCSKIFKKVTTDQGICCAFNMEEADKIFVESDYTTTIKMLQKEEEEKAFQGGNMSGWEWYQQNNEPKSQPGSEMGLTVVLDAHTDIIAEYTVNTDFKEITAAIIPPGDFPLTSQNSIKLKPGHNNIISLLPTQISSDPSIKAIDPQDRKCFSRDETFFIKLHRNYSQRNCLFECTLAQAKNTSHMNCNPWFFPSLNAANRLCGPREKTAILEAMRNDVPPNACDHCLPDCDQTIYHPMVTTQELRVCDEKNFGMAVLCSLDSIDVWPQIWGDQVLDQPNITVANFSGSTVFKKIKSRQRIKTLLLAYNRDTPKEPQKYDAYKDYIAVVNVYFSSPSVMKFTTKINKTWIDFISGIGGNVGLFIGFSFVTIFELLWLLIRVIRLLFLLLGEINL